ncbi:hypothetical protein [Vibrio algarum]|uniref:Anti-sigma factor n=1 Tax=Vibrio algarum TaxID=3020714 RepID=A0ABT4YX81_9VIBR|nr:hypothetical protein [Vibrio sp. KJ40-1]MDB1125766.1 hypothetical protein [Vibrio sp. KJ40-1]
MNRPLKDEEIVSLYEQGATESPSPDLDKTILNYANTQTKNKNQRNWWPYFGLAASVTFVTLLAPWEWAEQTLTAPTQLDNQQQTQQMEAALNKRVTLEKKAKEMNVESLQSRSLMKSAPQAEVLEMRIEQELASADDYIDEQPSPFKEVEDLLANGEKEQALKLLEEILTENPRLEIQLPEILKALRLDDADE